MAAHVDFAAAKAWVHKANPRVTTWHKRYLSLSSDGATLEWRETETGEAKGSVPIAEIKNIGTGTKNLGRFQKKPPTPYALTLVFTSRKDTLFAFDTEEAQLQWIAWIGAAQDKVAGGGDGGGGAGVAGDEGGAGGAGAGHRRSTLMGMAPLKLTLDITRGQDLPAADASGTSDPYIEVCSYAPLDARARAYACELMGEAGHTGADAYKMPTVSNLAATFNVLQEKKSWLRTVMHKSPVLKKQLTPAFNELVPDVLVKPNDVIAIEIFDWDRFTSNDLMCFTLLLPEWFVDKRVAPDAAEGGAVNPDAAGRARGASVEDVTAPADVAGGRGRWGVGLATRWPAMVKMATSNGSAGGFLMFGVKAAGAPLVVLPDVADDVAKRDAEGGAGGADGDAAGAKPEGGEAEEGGVSDAAAAAFASAGARAHLTGPYEGLSQFEAEDLAATKLQMAFRVHRARKQTEAMRAKKREAERELELNKAATRLQGRWRIYKARKEVAEVRARNAARLAAAEAESKAALILQRAVRRYQAVKKVQSRRMELEAELKRKEAEAAAAQALRFAGEGRLVQAGVEFLESDSYFDWADTPELRLAMAKAAVKMTGLYQMRKSRREVAKRRAAHEAELKRMEMTMAMEADAADAKATKAAAERNAKLKADMDKEASAAMMKVHRASIVADSAEARAAAELADARDKHEREMAEHEAMVKGAICIQRAYRHRLHEQAVEKRMVEIENKRFLEELKQLANAFKVAREEEDAARLALHEQLEKDKAAIKPLAASYATERARSEQAAARVQFKIQRMKRDMAPKLEPLIEARKAKVAAREAASAAIETAKKKHDAELERLHELGERKRAERRRKAEAEMRARRMQAKQQQEADEARRRLYDNKEVAFTTPLRCKVVASPDAPEINSGTWELVIRTATVLGVGGGMTASKALLVARVGPVGFDHHAAGADKASATSRDSKASTSSDAGPLVAVADGADPMMWSDNPMTGAGRDAKASDGGKSGGAVLAAGGAGAAAAATGADPALTPNEAALVAARVAPGCRVLKIDGMPAGSISARNLARRLTAAKSIVVEVPKVGAGAALGKVKSAGSAAMAKLRSVGSDLDRYESVRKAKEQQKRAKAAAKNLWQQIMAVLDTDPEIEATLEYIEAPKNAAETEAAHARLSRGSS